MLVRSADGSAIVNMSQVYCLEIEVQNFGLPKLCAYHHKSDTLLNHLRVDAVILAEGSKEEMEKYREDLLDAYIRGDAVYKIPEKAQK